MHPKLAPTAYTTPQRSLAERQPGAAPAMRRGWTLIEVTAVLAVLLLLVLALPKVSGQALPGPEDALRGYAGAAASAMAINHAACQLQAVAGAPSPIGPCRRVDSCADVTAIAALNWPPEIEVLDTAIGAGQFGAEAVCTLHHSGARNPSASFVGISAGAL